MKKNNLHAFWLCLILVLAFGLRFFQLGSNPPSLTWDEAAWGYNAYSLSQTGKDEFGRFLPVNYLESFGDYKPPMYAYLAVLPIKIFGLNEFAVRFPSAFFGVLTVVMTYLLARELFPAISPRRGRQAMPSRWLTLPLAASFLLAISPWHIMLSRAAFEANVASFFLVGGVTFFLIGAGKKGFFLYLSAIFFAFSLYTFNTSRIVAPLLVLGLTLGFRKILWREKKVTIRVFVLGMVLLIPTISFFLTPQSRLRFREVNIFSDSAVVVKANQEMENDNWAWWSNIIHNRRWGFFREFLRHYFDHFNPSFLFVKGDGNPKFSTQDTGALYLWELPFLILGALLLFRNKPGNWWLVPFWLLAGIVPAATARETPHALRIETTLPTWQILTALGVVHFIELIKKMKSTKTKILLSALSFLLLALNFLYFQHGYWRHYKAEFSGEWQYGYKQAIEFIKTAGVDYDEIWFTDKLGRPYIYFLFHTKKNPEEYWSEAKVERDAYGFVKVKSFSKYHFYSPDKSPWRRGVLFVDTADNVPEKAKVLETIRLLNGQEILKIFETGFET